MSTANRDHLRRLLLGVLVSGAVALSLTSGGVFAHRATSASSSPPLIVPHGVALRGAARSGEVNLATLPPATPAQLQQASRGTPPPDAPRTPAQQAAFDQWARSHPDRLPKVTATPWHAPQTVQPNLDGNGAIPVLLNSGPGLNTTVDHSTLWPAPAVAAALGSVFEGTSGALEVFSTTYGKKYGPWTPSQLFASVLHSGDSFANPQITYDAERVLYLIAWEEIGTGTVYLDLAISKTATPSPLGNFLVFQEDPRVINADDTCQRPTLGYDYWGLYVTCLNLSNSTGETQGNLVFALSINDLLTGAVTGWVWQNIPTDVTGCVTGYCPAIALSPSIEDGVSQAEWITATDAVEARTSANLTLCAITNTHALNAGSSPTITCNFNTLPVAYDDFIWASEPGLSQSLLPGYGFQQVAYRNGQLYMAQTEAVNCSGVTEDGIQWLVVQPQLTTLAAHRPQWDNGLYLTQEGEWCFTGLDTYNPAIMAGSEGDIALTFTVSNSTVYPSLLYTGSAATDASDSMGQGGVWNWVIQGANSVNPSVFGAYTTCALTTNSVTRGIVYCAGQFGGPQSSLTGSGWDTELFALRME